jgi:hypothetical protein
MIANNGHVGIDCTVNRSIDRGIAGVLDKTTLDNN